MKHLYAMGAAAAALLGGAGGASAQTFTAGNLVVSRSVYSGDSTTVAVGQNLPDSKDGTTPYKAVADGSYLNVFNNAKVDGSFGVTAPIFLDQVTTAGVKVNTVAINPGRIVTSFASKSELALNLSTDGHSLSFMGYAAPVNALDVSNSNTPGTPAEPGNFVTTAPTYRTIAQVDASGNVQTTNTSAYSGNNGRAALYDSAHNDFLTVGNAGNGSGSDAITAETGVQLVTPGQNPAAATRIGFYNITQNGYAADKTAKDNNFRGETVFNNTLYVTKGSGGNGINTVYQVGAAGTLPTAASAANAPISILPGFSTTLANGKSGGTVFHPFGLFFANPTTLYVADEGNQSLSDTAASNQNAGLEKYSLVGGSWTLDYTLQAGLNLDQMYGVAGLPLSLDPATDGLRNLTGTVNSDGTVSLFGITSTVSASGDQGADPNKLVGITDTLAFTTLAQAAGESFTTLQSAGYGEVLRGVAFAPTPAPVPEAPSSALLGAGMLGLFGVFLRKRLAAE